MSRAYMEWKNNIKKFRRGEWFEVRDGYIISLCDTSLSAYRRMRRVREREIKRMNRNSKILNDFMKHLKIQQPSIWEE